MSNSLKRNGPLNAKSIKTSQKSNELLKGNGTCRKIPEPGRSTKRVRYGESAEAYSGISTRRAIYILKEYNRYSRPTGMSYSYILFIMPILRDAAR